MQSKYIARSVLLLLCLTTSVALRAQDSTDDRLRRIEETLRTLSAQVGELTSRLRPPSPVEAMPSQDLTLGSTSRRGSPDAKLVLIEFSDFQCPFCARHAQSTYAEIQRVYVSTGKIQYAFRHFPLTHIHPAAQRAAEAAVCADQQGRFWEFHDRLFVNQQGMDSAAIREHAKAVEVDLPKFGRVCQVVEKCERVMSRL